MSRPLIQVTLANIEGRESVVQALFDPGFHPTVVRESRLPPGTEWHRFPLPRRLGRLHALGRTVLAIHIGDRMVEDRVYIGQNLREREMIIGAGRMRSWRITIVTEDGRSTVRVGLDSRDPEANEVL